MTSNTLRMQYYAFALALCAASTLAAPALTAVVDPPPVEEEAPLQISERKEDYFLGAIFSTLILAALAFAAHLAVGPRGYCSSAP